MTQQCQSTEARKEQSNALRHITQQ